jgi:hypothetical protein
MRPVEMCQQQTSSSAEDSLYVIAVRIEHEGRVVTLRKTFCGIAKARPAIIGSTCFEGRRVKGVDLGAVPGSECRMLLHAVGMKAIDPENRILDTIADGIGSIVFGKLHDPAQTERAKSRVIKSRGPANLRDADTRMVNHVTPPSRTPPCNGVVVYLPYLMGQYCGMLLRNWWHKRLRGCPMTLKAVPAFVMIAIIGLGVQAEARMPCQEYLRLRNAATEAWKQAMRAPPSERCGALNHASLAAKTTLKYVDNNRESCDISVQLLNQVEGYHRGAIQARDNACAGRPLRPYRADIVPR